MAVTEGQTVRVHYTGTLENDTVFDTSEGRAPLQFVVGQGDVIPGFDKAVLGMEVGDKVEVTIPAAEAYGERFEEGLQEYPLDAFPGVPTVGWAVELTGPDEQRIAATIIHVGEESATLDFNHPLAGQDLTFQIELVEVVGD